MCMYYVLTLSDFILIENNVKAVKQRLYVLHTNLSKFGHVVFLLLQKMKICHLG